MPRLRCFFTLYAMRLSFYYYSIPGFIRILFYFILFAASDLAKYAPFLFLWY
jgi:hypothetical protein